MGELYREIDNVTEFRGQGYFEATWALEKKLLDATPPKWQFAMYPNDRLILEELGNDDYRIVGVAVGDRWGIPLPENQQDVEYRVFKHTLKDMQPREILA